MGDGATTGAVTHYFDGKDALLEAALDAIMERLLARAGEARAGDGVAHAAAALPIDSAARREWRVWLAFCGRAVHAPRLRARHADHYRRIVDALRQAGLDRESADAVVAAIDGVGLRATLEPDDWPPARQVATLERLLRPLLARKDP
jgi:TetR/AcrR family transcriptional repressor of bet genes